MMVRISRVVASLEQRTITGCSRDIAKYYAEATRKGCLNPYKNNPRVSRPAESSQPGQLLAPAITQVVQRE